MLKARVGAVLDVPKGIRATKLFPLNEHVESENMKELSKLEGDAIE
jgi:hypothetical protein